jgi:hypothetical protein
MQASSAATQQPCPSPLSASSREYTTEDLKKHFGTDFQPSPELIKAIEAGY